ncbi:MAG: lipopolysaccharide heptosyltransferase II [Desulfobacula sp.]|jgi:heptosyltransferase-2|uniref:lipopolysaccharide heptosyltransferase II n=1 Tax=Desulfobacula sp. TaxID=2593537 RepID=UPI001D2562A4|nr:lipopolysaccharide heptosyltransferase II [Desulfobacula sp.]MBT3484487.1 lipopolysaccharide heptosyltransferase II [Desulfobacula sp.]MBT3803125.1 lipopolysaccharide heptosyltransferase II [Desulfobacula sp.]MBT4024695.1 lipopolysaccharide heptosyltransferase II [Desulfobacula sp.]MBT4197173.1 lipopolysaccharide heptosyltransferase II [Desulfobacula sp.]
MGFIDLIDSGRAKIMIRAANWVGDAIMTTPVIRAVRKNYPAAVIIVLAKPWVIPVYENNPYIDKILLYDNSGRHKKGFGTLALAKDLRTYRFDLTILMQNAFEAGLIAFLGGIKERIGYNTDGRGFLLNRGIKLNPDLKKGHLIDYYIGILKGAHLEDDGRNLDLFLCKSDRKFANRFLELKKFDSSQPVIGINPGATGGTAKRWFPERYAEVCKNLAQKFKVKIFIFGGPADIELGEYIAGLSRGCCINIAGKTSLGQAFALIEKCSLFITNDSGLMHAAAALNINQLAVIGSTDYIATAPSNKNSIMVRAKVPCSPCLKDICPTNHKCMDKISVDMVMETCKSLLKDSW